MARYTKKPIKESTQMASQPSMQRVEIPDWKRRREAFENHGTIKDLETTRPDKKRKKSLIYLLCIMVIIGIIATNFSGSVTGTYHMGFYECTLKENGNCTIWQSSDRSSMYCRTGGTYTVDGKFVILSGLFNSNCQSVSGQNGKYIIDGGRLVGPS